MKPFRGVDTGIFQLSGKTSTADRFPALLLHAYWEACGMIGRSPDHAARTPPDTHDFLSGIARYGCTLCEHVAWEGQAFGTFLQWNTVAFAQV
jgi:hypothetical protein